MSSNSQISATVNTARHYLTATMDMLLLSQQINIWNPLIVLPWLFKLLELCLLTLLQNIQFYHNQASQFY